MDIIIGKSSNQELTGYHLFFGGPSRIKFGPSFSLIYDLPDVILDAIDNKPLANPIRIINIWIDDVTVSDLENRLKSVGNTVNETKHYSSISDYSNNNAISEGLYRTLEYMDSEVSKTPLFKMILSVF